MLLTLAASLLLAGLSAGCATYRPAPLPPIDAASGTQAPDFDRLTVAASGLSHALLPPVALDVNDGLSPDEAAVVAVLNNPDLRVVRDARGEAQAQLLAAGLLPNPVLTAEFDRTQGAVAESTVDPFVVSLEESLNELITRSARRTAAKAQLASVDLGIAWHEWQVAQAARLAAVRLAMLGRRLDLVLAEAKFEQETVAVLETAVKRHDATVEDLGVHRSALASLRQQAGDLEKLSTRERSRFNRILGLPPSSDIEIALDRDAGEDFAALPANPVLVRIATSARLDLQALQLGYAAQEARVRRAVLNQFPSISIGIVRQRNEAAVQFLGGFVSLGLPIFRRNQGVIAIEQATRRRLRDEYAARISAIRADVAELADVDRILGRQIATARRSVAQIAAIEEAERRGVLSGDVDRLAWQQVRTSLVELKIKLAALVQARLESRVALTTATGGPVPLTALSEGSVLPDREPSGSENVDR
ncbi:MAG: TolC family protein [Acidobacteriota bacterium]